MGSGLDSWEDDEGLPDAAFTEGELASGVQHIMRTGNPNATFSGRKPVFWTQAHDDCGGRGGSVGVDSVQFSRNGATLRFETFAQARMWAQANPGGVITRASDGHGFEAKQVQQELGGNPTQSNFDTYLKRTKEIKALAPHLHDVLSKSASNSRRLSMHPFDLGTWQSELSRLSTDQLKHLRMLIATHLEDSRKRLRFVYAEMRRFPSMKAGHYGEELSERLNKIMEKALNDILTRLTEGSDF